jgi:hypothetical protein
MGSNIDPPRFEDSIVRWWEQKVPGAPEKTIPEDEREPSDVHDDDSPVNDSSRTV